MATTKLALDTIALPIKEPRPHSSSLDWLLPDVTSALQEQKILTMPWTSADHDVCDYLLSENDPCPVLLTEASRQLQTNWTHDRLGSMFKGHKCTEKSYLTGKTKQTTIDKFMDTFNQNGDRQDPRKLQVRVAHQFTSFCLQIDIVTRIGQQTTT